LALFASCLFGGAGTMAWAAGWSFLALFFGCLLVLTILLVRQDQALLAERMKGTNQPGQPLWDKLFLIGLQIVWYGWLILIGADAVRFRWSAMPLWLQVLGAVLLVLGNWMIHLTFRANTFLAPVVRIQAERGHRVITTGPYAVVRHPMYAAAWVMMIGMTLMLGSWYGLLVALALSAALGYRSVGEERVLRRSLEGYEAYAARVRWRLVPGIW
jgi:protein-S-isoprenylcysteine O-methyltransferase Ste14